MTQPTRTALLFTLCATAVAATLTPGLAAADGRPAVRAEPAFAWHACEPSGGAPVPAGQECASLRVPLDYRDPGGPAVEVAVARLRTDRPAARRGTLLVIPGGPGSSGVQRLAQKGEALRAATGGGYDLVSLDPRGVGGSTRGRCGLPAGDRWLTTLRSWPDADGGIAENTERARRTAASCESGGDALLRSVSTLNEARDIDRLRGALGERELTVWGTSYGAYVGAVYAQKFPQRVDRLVLDSTGDPDPARVAHGWLENMAAGAADRFPDFAAWAADPAREEAGLRLADRAEDVEPLLLALARRLDGSPRASDVAGVPLTGNGLRQALQNALYSDAAFPALARLVRAAQDPLGRPVLPPELARALPDEDASLMVAGICNDVRWPSSAAGYARRVAADRERYPLTAGMPANITPCAFWKSGPSEKPVRITGEGPSEVLMIQSLRDPATPYAGALRMREALGDRARMVTVGQGGHGMYLGNGNACGDRAVSAFLVDGVRPARDAHCPN
ncbi:Tripeptidyl aminopeptidase precursor [Streptomyces sp. ADI96-02]|uniref:alpha/beta hydrolase n=1 Tax=Streptomyces sp. ADI96-02 TaxID=1522760 RepID=UPI000F54FF9C|nr:alpha/beta hydrolase [Streptomyces sp. ADI96-02]RPK62566.1 Tripeptidyl aminopeptidase precursor [Streptomyces sp. ADI96-02]